MSTFITAEQYLFIMNIVQKYTYTKHTEKKQKQKIKTNYEVHKNSIKAFKTKLLNKYNSK